MHVLICDDDMVQSVACKRKILALAEHNHIAVDIEMFDTGEQMLIGIEDQITQIDVIYLDINMPGINGMQTARQLRELDYQGDIVFLTVDKRFVFDAFDVEALHYIVKRNTDDEQFRSIFLKAAKRASRRNVETLLLSCAGEQRRIPIQEIIYFEVCKRIITVHYGDGETFEFYSNLSKIEEWLFGKGFVRSHVSYLVAERAIKRVSRSDMRLINGETLPVSRAYYASLAETQT